MNTNRSRNAKRGTGVLLAIAMMVFVAGCDDPEPADPAALIPGWRTYYNREVGVEFKYPYTLKLNVDTLAGGHLSAELLWVGNEASVFKLETRAARGSNGGGSAAEVGGKPATQSVGQVDGEEVQQTLVEHGGRVFVFTGSGRSYDDVLQTVKFLDR